MKACREKTETPADASHQLKPVKFEDAEWDLSHLDAFTFKRDVGFEVNVLVIFSSHCFTHSFRWDTRQRSEIPAEEIYHDGREERVLDKVRYELYCRLLKPILLTLDQRRIVVANESSRNFMTVEVKNEDGSELNYAVFFDVEKDQKRRRRLILRVQSAYCLAHGLTKRQKEAKKVNLDVLLKAAYEGRGIRP